MILVLFITLLSFCALSWVYWIVASVCLRGVLKQKESLLTNALTPPLSQGEREKIKAAPQSQSVPMVSLLKPVKGLDNGALGNLATFCQQDYPRFELLFGVADKKDPAVRLVEQLREQFPQHSIRLVVAQPLGTNPKASTLNTLAAEARGEVLVISDSDIRVTSDYVSRVVAPLADQKVGVVTCLYRGQSPKNLPARLEALHMDASFAPSAALAWRLGNPVGLGATLAMRRKDLEHAGGYAAIANHLLDDNEVAARIRRLGLRVYLSDYVVGCLLGPTRFAQQWAREVRWSRGIRVAYPLRYLGVIITFSLPLALLVAGFSFWWHWAWVVVPLSLASRWTVGWYCARLLGQSERSYLLWLPLRDLLSAAVWTVAWFGRTVEWRGEEFLLNRDGTLRSQDLARRPDGVLARAIRSLDRYLRKKEGIFEFSSDPRCVLRASIGRSETDLELSDGTSVRKGDAICILHLWNEQLPLIPRGGADLQWAMTIRKATERSLRQLARIIEKDERFDDVEVFGGHAVFVSRNGEAQVARIVQRYGFETVEPQRRRSLMRRLHDLGENVLVLGLQWAFNPAGLRGKSFMRPRTPIWISRETLMRKYGPRKYEKAREPVAG